MDGELYHYGVIGMKWGIRRNPTKTYVKAKKKLAKAERKAVKATKRAKRRDRSIFVSDERAYKSLRKANKRNRKVQKLKRAMDIAFKDVDKKHIDEGRAILAEIRRNRKKNESTL